MIPRQIQSTIPELVRAFPVLTILGPRQSGKTTLVKATFPNYNYVNLEEPQDRELALSDPYGFFNKYPAPVIIDEVQRVPELLSIIQVLCDKSKEMGQYILTGSHQPALHEKISQSLAGRAAIITLYPLSIAELANANIDLSRDEYLFNGFMPAIYDRQISPTTYYSNYYATYIERDVRQLINVSKQHSFETFIKLLAGRVGQLINISSLANDAGVSNPTINSWLSILEASYIIFRLTCYYKNFGKRLTKSQKIYFTDVGLLTYLLGLTDISQISRDPLIGNIFENMVIMEVIKANITKNIYFYRNNTGLEIDLLIQKGLKLIPIEIKSASTYNSAFSKNLIALKKLAKDELTTPCVFYAGDFEATQNGVEIVNYKKCYKKLTINY